MNMLEGPVVMQKKDAVVEIGEDGTPRVVVLHDDDKTRVIEYIEEMMRDLDIPLKAIEEVGSRLTIRYAPQGYNSWQDFFTQHATPTYTRVPFPDSRIADKKFLCYTRVRPEWIEHVRSKKEEYMEGIDEDS